MMDFDAAIKEAQERAESLDREIKIAEWERYTFEAQTKDRVVKLREQVFGALGEVAALKKIRDEKVGKTA